MVYVIALGADEVDRIKPELNVKQRFTKALPPRMQLTNHGPRLALVLSQANDHPGVNDRTLVWIGVVLRSNTVGAVDRSITIDPLRECQELVRLDGSEGLLIDLPEPHRKVFNRVTTSGDVQHCEPETWNALASALRNRYRSMARLIDWLTALANPPILSSSTAEERSWQEQGDAFGTALRIGGFPLSTATAWTRPVSPDAPYLAGLIGDPVEQSMIEHDARASVNGLGLFDEWQDHDSLRYDIHVIHDAEGRRLEVANVNSTPVESRLGTDLIYYHEGTHSFVLVQYKRLDSRSRSVYVDARMLSQMDRLERVAHLSREPGRFQGCLFGVIVAWCLD